MHILLFDYKCTLSLSSGQMHLVGNNFTQEKRELLHTVPKHLEKCFIPQTFIRWNIRILKTMV